jgi:TPP-dependent pyruvate/acetoin dehydrogenase alpha subunit
VGPNSDYQLGFRTEDEAVPWITSDPVTRLAQYVDGPRRAEIDREVEAEIAEAFAFADASPYPAGAELYTDVYKED